MYEEAFIWSDTLCITVDQVTRFTLGQSIPFQDFITTDLQLYLAEVPDSFLTKNVFVHITPVG